MDKTWNEEALLKATENCFGIYQIDESSPAGEYMFESKGFLDRVGFAIDRDNYKLVYIAPWDEGMDLEKVFLRFNLVNAVSFEPPPGRTPERAKMILSYLSWESVGSPVPVISEAVLLPLPPPTGSENVTDGNLE